MRLSVIFCLLTACAPTFDLNQPLVFQNTAALDAKLDLEDRQALFAQTLADGVAQLGGTVAAVSSNPTITADLYMSCTEYSGGASAGYLGVCNIVLGGSPYVFRGVTLHELGHALGAGHVPCDGVSIMCDGPLPDLVEGYSGGDLAEICRHATGGRCGR